MAAFQEPVEAPFPYQLKDRLNDPEDRSAKYRVSNLVTRAVIGVIGFVLPFILIFWEGVVLDQGGVKVRGSLSAYYHTSARDIFVAALCIIGFFLMTYLSGERRTLGFWLSLVAGMAVLGVAFFPKTRPSLPPGAPECGTLPMPEGCSPIQQVLGEQLVAQIHFVCAAVFILILAAICFLVFAKGEEQRSKDPRWGTPPWMATVIRICGGVILLAVLWVAASQFLELTIGPLTPLYLAEVVSVWAFGVAWLLKARDLMQVIPILGRAAGRPPVENQQPAAAD
jgi:hypothetical protein